MTRSGKVHSPLPGIDSRSGHGDKHSRASDILDEKSV
jgi:hypothetical protein